MFNGVSVDLTFDTLQTNYVYMKTSCAWDMTGGQTAEYTVTVRYVRKEIREESPLQRERFFEALSTVYRVDTEEGKELYGEKYKSIKYFVSQHLDGAADITCDHWHDDAGVMSHHMAFTLEMEQALQAVDKTVTIPYWDYTRDSYVPPYIFVVSSSRTPVYSPLKSMFHHRIN